jgi:hypothetical protein
MTGSRDAFYIGYLAHAPNRLPVFLRRVVLGFGLLAVFLALVLVAAQEPFTPAQFEYLQTRSFEGVLKESPVPRLRTAERDLLIAAFGKHGAGSLVRGFDGSGVRVEGSLIHRAEGAMLEIAPGTIRPAAVDSGPSARTDFGEQSFTGEIVDTKCFLGVMNPGAGKVHRECAARCISGGIPAALLARDASGGGRLLLLVRDGGVTLGRELLDYVAEPVRVRGRLVRDGGAWFLETSPAAVSRDR